MEDNRTLTVNGLDLMVLLYHVHRHAKKHGHLDADRSLSTLTRMLSPRFSIPASLLESGLYCCNMLDEEEEFWHPGNLNFNQFLQKVLKGKTFNKTYNWIEDGKDA